MFSLILVSFGLAFAFLPHLAQVYSAVSTRELMRPFLLGTVWGFAQLGAVISVHRLGLAVGGAILNSIGAAFGTLLPLIFIHREEMLDASGVIIHAGILTMFLGVALCAERYPA